MSFGKWHDIEVEDDVTAYVEYPNGATGTFVTTTGDCAGTNRFEINFDQGKLISENGKLYLWRAECSEQEWSKKTLSPSARRSLRILEVETDGKSEQHVGVLNASRARSCAGNRSWRGEEGYQRPDAFKCHASLRLAGTRGRNPV